MPTKKNSFKTPRYFLGKHSETLLPSMFRRVNGVKYIRERIDTPDGDFLDLDWSSVGSNHLVIISHGIFGSTNRAYIKGMVKSMNFTGYDALAWNYRCCSEEPNRTKQLYHAGSTKDLESVISHARKLKRYTKITLVGFSLGGNITLNYLKERGRRLYPELKKAVAISTPCDLSYCGRAKKRWMNRLYIGSFIKNLKKKIAQKAHLFPDFKDIDWKSLKTLKDFDNALTAPLHGFIDANDYYEKCSVHEEIHRIKLPTLILNAENDPFLSPSCFPIKACDDSKFVTLEIPKRGGHAGFIWRGMYKETWAEKRTVDFIQDAA